MVVWSSSKTKIHLHHKPVDFRFLGWVVVRHLFPLWLKRVNSIKQRENLTGNPDFSSPFHCQKSHHNTRKFSFVAKIDIFQCSLTKENKLSYSKTEISTLAQRFSQGFSSKGIEFLPIKIKFSQERMQLFPQKINSLLRE